MFQRGANVKLVSGVKFRRLERKIICELRFLMFCWFVLRVDD